MSRSFRRGARGGRNRIVRPVDWDWARTYGLIGNNSGYYTWMRVPADSDDVDQDLFITPKTLVRTLVRGDIMTNSLPEPSNVLNGTFYFGLIAWKSSTTADPTFGFAGWPDPTNGAYDWIFWCPVVMTNVGGVGVNFKTSFFGLDTESGWCQSRAMRKLPPQTGILCCMFYDGNLGNDTEVGINIAVRMALKGDFSAPGLGGS